MYMILFAYMDLLPPVPMELILQQQKNIKNFKSGLERRLDSGEIAHNIDYDRWDLSEELIQWLKYNVCEADSMGLQISSVRPDSDTHLCHTDSYPRRWVLNYMYETGGENIQTRFFREPGQELIRPPFTAPTDLDALVPLHSLIIETNRWYLLNSSVLHDVVGITGSRASITLGMADDDPFFRIKGYQGRTLADASSLGAITA